MPLSICSDSEDDQENRPQSAKTSIDLSSLPWPNNIVNLEDVSLILCLPKNFFLLRHFLTLTDLCVGSYFKFMGMSVRTCQVTARAP